MTEYIGGPWPLQGSCHKFSLITICHVSFFYVEVFQFTLSFNSESKTGHLSYNPPPIWVQPPEVEFGIHLPIFREENRASQW